MSDEVIVYVLNDHIIKVTGLRDGATSQYINDATVQATMVDHNGAEVEGVTWPLTLNYVADSDGNYVGLLEEELKVSPSGIYHLVVDAEAVPDVKGHWRKPVTVKERV